MARTILILLVLAGLQGCSTPKAATGAAPITQEELRDRLLTFGSAFTMSLTATADRLGAARTDRETRIYLLRLKIRTLELYSWAISSQEPTVAFLDLWSVCAQARLYFANGEGEARRLLGEGADAFVAVLTDLTEEIRGIGSAFMTTDQLAKASEDIEAFARANPRSGFSSQYDRPSSVAQGSALSSLSFIVDIPMSPFRAFEGVDAGAQAIHEFNQVAATMASIVAGLPQQLRWQSELMLLEADRAPAVDSALSSFKTLSDSIAGLQTTAEKLPADLRLQVSGVLDEVDARQANLQQTLGEAREAISDLDKAVVNADGLATTLDQVTANFAEAGRVWDETLKTFGHVFEIPGPPPPPDAPPRTGPSDLDNLVAITANATDAFTKLGGSLEELKAILEDDRLGERIDEVNSSAQALADTLMWRGMILIAGFFVAAVGYKLLVRRGTSAVS